MNNIKSLLNNMTKKGKRHTFKRGDLVDSIIKMRIDKGMSRLSILNFLKEELKLSQPYAYELIADASKEFDQRAVQNFGKDIKEDIERFEKLYEDAIKNKNHKEARELLKEISKIKGHYVERVELSGSIEHTIQIIKLNGPDGKGITD
jgi:hypothetical protein